MRLHTWLLLGLLLVGGCCADNILSRMLRQVVPTKLRSYIVGVDLDPLEAVASRVSPAIHPVAAGDSSAEAGVGDYYDDSYAVATAVPEVEAVATDRCDNCTKSSGGGGGGDTSGWNPFTWFVPRARDIPYNPDQDLQTCEIATRHGYQCEGHTVITDDGYLLTMHRLPCSRADGCRPHGRRGSGQPVFLQHGLLSSSADWLLSGPGKALAFVLADAGYDVWLGNARGNTYSKRHIRLRHDDPEFWDFSWHEMAEWDIPAEIDYVYKIRGLENPARYNRSTEDGGPVHDLLYVGHSMGTTMVFAMLSLRPEYNAKIRAAFALAPVAYMSKVKSPIRLLAPFSKDIRMIVKFLGANEFLPQNKVLQFLAKYGCEMTDAERYICENSVFVLCGFDKAQFNEALMPVILGHTPAGTSTKTVVHYAQEIHESGNFQYFDYGTKANQLKYGQDTPPQYDLRNVTAPIALFYAKNDWLAGPEDVGLLFDRLHRTAIGLFKVPFDQFNHVDFLWGKDAPALVYTKMMEVMARFR